MKELEEYNSFAGGDSHKKKVKTSNITAKSDGDKKDIIIDLRGDDTKYSSCHLPKIIDDYVNPTLARA